jgi:hypothetical protein
VPKPKTEKLEPRPVTHAQLFALAGILAAGAFAVRIAWPAGREWHHLQLAFFPQYVTLFTLGTMAERRGWLDALSPRLLRVWVPIMIVDVACLVTALVMLLPKGKAAIVPWLGGMHPEAFAIATTESLWCVGASVTVLVLFRERFSGDRWARALGGDAYTVYIIHAPVIVAIAVAMKGLDLGPFVKFATLTLLGTAACFAASHYVLRRSAFVRRVL